MNKTKKERMTVDDWESGLAGALDVVVAQGWKPTRTVTCDENKKECCALGALKVLGLTDVPLSGSKPRNNIAPGFDAVGRSYSLRGFKRVGYNLAKIFVDGEG